MTVVEAKGLIKEYGTLVAVKDVSFSINKGQIVGLVGPNGAGKTTLMRMLSTILEPTAGTAFVSGLDIKSDYLKIRKNIGYLPDFFNLYEDLTIYECLEYFAKAYGVPQNKIPDRIDTILRDLDLEAKRTSFIKNLSRGMIQRLGIGVLMAHSPEVFILDEPASGLDPKARMDLRTIMKHLSQEGKTVIISSHILTELSGLCTHVAIMNHGEIVQFGEVNEIEKSITGAGSLKITVLRDCDKAVDLIREFVGTGITRIEPDNNTILISIEDKPETIAALNRHLIENGIEVTLLCQETTTLEDVYLKISSQDNNNNMNPKDITSW